MISSYLRVIDTLREELTPEEFREFWMELGGMKEDQSNR